MARFYYFIIIPIAVVIYLAYMFFKMKTDKARIVGWLNENPNAAKVYIAKPTSLLGFLSKASNHLNVISVDGQRPLFLEKNFR